MEMEPIERRGGTPEKAADMPSHSHASGVPSTESVAEASPENSGEAQKSKAALSSVLWSGILTVTKIVAALSSNSLGLLSEALHSALDLVAAGITFVAVKISAIPADERHPFGHGKIENLSALVETALLVVTCAWIVREAVERLFFEAVHVEPSWWVFAVVLFSLVVDINRSAMLRKVAREHRSQALEADALHFTTDIWSSAVVLLGLGLALLAHRFELDTTAYLVLSKADAVAALGVAVIILKVSWSMAGRAVTALLDGGNEDEVEKIREALVSKAPAYTYSRIRVRDSGAGYFVDLVVETPAAVRVDVAHDVSDMLEKVVDSILPGAETTVHVEPPKAPGAAERTTPFAVCHGIALEHGLDIHNLVLTTMGDGLHVFVHIDLAADLDLRDAHAQVSAFEDALRNRVGAVHVVCHIEPGARLEEVEEARKRTDESKHILLELRRIMKSFSALCMCHDEAVVMVGNRTALSFRCKIKDRATVAEAHHHASLLEAELRKSLPELGRITIQVEPLQE